MLDDCSRLCCHLQWYLDETAETLCHGFGQAIQKRGMPRAALSDNGSAMEAAEFVEGLARLGIVHHTTLPYSPEQNAKQEVFWAQLRPGARGRDAGEGFGIGIVHLAPASATSVAGDRAWRGRTMPREKFSHF